MDDLLQRAREQMEDFNRRDVEAVVDRFSEDAEWWPLRSETEGPYRGHDGIRAWFADTAETFEYIRAHVEEAHEIPGGLISFGAIDVKGRESHVAMRIPITWLWRLENEKIRWARAYSDRGAALEEAGVSEDALS